MSAAPQETGPGASPQTPQAWMAHFRALVDSVVHDDGVARAAIEGIVNACEHGISEADHPADAIASIHEANRKTKVEALKILADFVALCGGDLPPGAAVAEAPIPPDA